MNHDVCTADPVSGLRNNPGSPRLVHSFPNFAKLKKFHCWIDGVPAISEQ